MYPALAPFAFATVALALNLFFLWGYSGSVRGRTKTSANEEDLKTVARGAALTATDPTEVARVLRAHDNAQANIMPTLALGLVYVLLGGPAQLLWIVLGAFTAGRWLHSLMYLAGKQPWRTIFFGIAGVASIVLLGYDGYLASKLL